MAKFDFPAMLEKVSNGLEQKVSVIAQNIGASIALDSMSEGKLDRFIDSLLVLQPCFVMEMGLFDRDEE